MVKSARMTANDLERWSDRDQDFELVRGVPYALAPAEAIPAVVAARLIADVGAYLKTAGLGEARKGGFLFERDPDTVLEPDLAVILTDEIPRLTLTGFVPFIPSLVAEVLSPLKRGVPISTKLAIYRQAGVEMIWIIDPPRRRAHQIGADGVTHELVEPAALTGGERFPGLSISLAELFRLLPLPPLAAAPSPESLP